MAAQGERVSGAIGIDTCCLVGEPMAQDGIPEQDIVVEELELPQTNPKLEMGAAAADFATLPTSVKSPPRPPVKPQPIMVERACFRHRASHS